MMNARKPNLASESETDYVSLICTPLLFAGIIVGCAFATAQESDPAPQPDPGITSPEFIVIYNYRVNVQDPLLNFRLVIHAKNEQDAIVRATRYIEKMFGAVIATDRMEFVEVAPKRVDK
jgi:hypothetical protein